MHAATRPVNGVATFPSAFPLHLLPMSPVCAHESTTMCAHLLWIHTWQVTNRQAPFTSPSIRLCKLPDRRTLLKPSVVHRMPKPGGGEQIALRDIISKSNVICATDEISWGTCHHQMWIFPLSVLQLLNIYGLWDIGFWGVPYRLWRFPEQLQNSKVPLATSYYSAHPGKFCRLLISNEIIIYMFIYMYVFCILFYHISRICHLYFEPCALGVSLQSKLWQEVVAFPHPPSPINPF